MSSTPSFCTQCGAPLKAHARFCSRCGAVVRPASAQQPALPAPQPRASPHPHHARTCGCLSLAGIAALGLALAGGWLLASGLPALPGGDAGPTAAPAAQLTPLVREVLAPADELQGLSWEGLVTLSVPGGLLTEPQPATIASVVGLPPPALPLPAQVLAQYDISIGDLQTFAQPLVIELAYDPGQLRGQRPAEEALAALYWDEQLGEWAALPAFVDPERHTVVAVTTHLTTIAAVELIADGSRSDGCFILSYDAADLRQQIATGQVNADYLETIWGALTHARAAYDGAGLPPICEDRVVDTVERTVTADGLVVYLPVRRVERLRQHAVMGGDGSPSRSKYTGTISIPYLGVATRSQQRLFVAHEVFHAVQARYYTMLGMTELGIPGTSAPAAATPGLFRVWWLDATAEYAAGRLAYPDGDRPHPSMGGAIPLRYLDESLLYAPSALYEFFGGNDPSRDHAYATAWFFEFLSRRYGVAFVPLFKQVAGSYNPSVVAALDAALADRCAPGGGLDACYRAFAQDWVFNAESPLPASPRDRIPPKAAEQWLLQAGEQQAEHQFALKPFYTAGLWSLGVAAPAGGGARVLRVEPAGDLPAGTALFVYLLPGRVRPAGGLAPVATFRAGTADLDETRRWVEVAVREEDGLYVLAVNSSGSAQALAVRVRDMAEPTPTPEPTAAPMAAPDSGARYEQMRVGGAMPSGWLALHAALLETSRGDPTGIETFTAVPRNQRGELAWKAGLNVYGKLCPEACEPALSGEELARELATRFHDWGGTASSGAMTLGELRGGSAELRAASVDSGGDHNYSYFYQASLVSGNAHIYLSGQVEVSAYSAGATAEAEALFSQLVGELHGAIGGLTVTLTP